MQYRNTDDLLSVLLKDTSQGLPFCAMSRYMLCSCIIDFRYRFITQTCRALGIHLSFVTDEEQKRLLEAFRLPSLSKVLSLQNVLGRNENGSRHLTSKVAWLAL